MSYTASLVGRGPRASRRRRNTSSPAAARKSASELVRALLGMIGSIMQPVTAILRDLDPQTSNASRLAAFDFSIRRAYTLIPYRHSCPSAWPRPRPPLASSPRASVRRLFKRPSCVVLYSPLSKAVESLPRWSQIDRRRVMSRFANSVTVQDVEAEAPTSAVALILQGLA